MGARENAKLAEARGHELFGVAAAFALTALMTLLYASAAWADTFTVTNTSNSGAGSLREAINKANASAGADQIVFADGVNGTITLASSLSTVTDPAGLTIDGGGDVTVSGNDTPNVHGVRVLAVGEGAGLSLRNLTVSDGEADLGGGIFNGGGTLTVSGSTFSDNDSDIYGGGIYNDEGGTAEVSGSTFSGNRAVDFGGGVFNNNGAKLTVTDSTFSANETADIGAGIANFGSVVVTGSTFSGNRADFGGGGIYNESGTLQVTNSTFSGNRDMTAGGGIWNSIGGTLEVVHSTFSGNISSEGAGGIAGGGMATLRGTIVANSVPGGNCFGVTDGGYNVDDDGTCGFSQAMGSLPNTDPLLDPDGLQDNGGPTKTIALQPDSPAVDLVAPDACPPPQTDQRGVERPQGEACDSGAFELVQGPRTKADCKKGGYREFGFKNQGQCIAFVNRSAGGHGRS